MTNCNYSEHTKIQRKEMQKQIEELQEKLKELEEKSPAEEAYKDWWGEYPGTEIWTKDDEMRWVSFSAGYNNASKVSETPQEPEELKTLYQMFYDEKWSSAGCDDICKVVEEWMSQYEIDRWCDDWDVGFSDCFYKLNKGLK